MRRSRASQGRRKRSGEVLDASGLVVENTRDLVSLVDLEGRIVYASPSHFPVLGYAPAELVGRMALELVHQDDRGRAEKAVAESLRNAGTFVSVVRLRHKDGHWVFLEGAGSAIPDEEGQPTLLLATSRDISARVQAERRLEAQYAVARVLAESPTLAEATPNILQVVGESLGWELGALWAVDSGEQVLRCVAVWHGQSLQLARFEALSRETAFPAGVGLPGRVWASAAPAWIADVLADPNFPRERVATSEGLHAAFAFPIVCGEKVVGVVEFFSGEIRQPDEDLLAMVAALGSQLGQFVERKRAEERLRRGEARTSAILEAALDCVITIDEEGKITEFNPAAARMFGYDRGEVIGKELAEMVVPPSLRERHRRGLARYLETGESAILGRRIELTAMHADGSEFPVELTVTRVDLPGPPLFTGYVRDLSERKQAEEALRKSHVLLAAVIEGTTDAVFVKDLEGRYLLINEAGARSLGVPAADILGKDVADLLPPENARQILERERALMRSGTTAMLEEVIATEDGSPRVFLSTKGPYRDGQGNIAGLIGIAREITEYRRLEAELRQAQKMEALGRLAGGVSHDFNNLLSVIGGFTKLALGEVKDGEPLRAWLEQVARAAGQAATLTGQLLAFSRKQVLETTVLGLNGVLAEMDALLRRALGEDLRLVTVFGAARDLVELNRGQLEQVILNLALNARDAMPGGGTLTLETGEVELDDAAGERLGPAAGPYVLLKVSDTGSGIDEGTQAHIFEPFFTTKEVGKGTGLGLSTVYGIVTQSGGHVEVESKPGRGATFTIYLAQAREHPAGPAEEERALVMPTSPGTVLVAEDEAMVRALVREVLEREGYAVLAAGSGEEALEIAQRRRGPIDALVTDIVMPGMRGSELAARLTSVRPETRVLFMSGYSDDDVAQDLLRAGGAFLPKPFDPDLLLAKLSALLQSATRDLDAAHRSSKRSAATGT
jgi:two-component system cell cycle sensor histidine kinase/response regulator CckA